MRWIVLLLLLVLAGLLIFRSPAPAPVLPSTPRTSASSTAGASSSASNGAGFEDVFFLREPVDVSSTPWNGILNAGTPVRKVGQEGNKVILETGNGRVTVDADKITHDPKASRQITDTLARPGPSGAPVSTPAPTSTPAPAAPSTGGGYVNPLVPPPAADR